jgi:hypothetical protein
LGSVIGNPFDVLKTMQMANTSATAEPLGALVQNMLRDQGIKGFYRGVEANILRACVLNGTKMSCYDVVKSKVERQTGWGRKDLRTQFLSATGAGFFMTVTVSPFDNVRTHLASLHRSFLPLAFCPLPFFPSALLAFLISSLHPSRCAHAS